MEETAVVAQARVIYEQFQAELLAASPLGAIGDWVASGSPPPAEVLRSYGFNCTTERGDLNLARKAFIRDWGYSIPCHEAVEALRDLGPIVEVGCGSGYWSALLRNAGLDVAATDAEAGLSPFGFRIGRYAEATRLSAIRAVQTYPERAVFCSWPSPDDPWATELVQSLSKGRTIALILHEKSPTTGDAALVETLDSSCDLISTVQIPQFPQVPDRLVIYRRG